MDVHLKRADYRDNKIKLSEIIIKLKRLDQIHPDKAADYYYRIGNAWYNMSQKGWFMNNSYYIGNDHRNSISGSSYSDDDGLTEQIDHSFILEQQIHTF